MDFTVQFSCIWETDKHIGGPLAVPADQKDNDGWLLQIFLDDGLFLMNTDIRHKTRYQLSRRPPSPSHLWTQVDPIVLGHQWHPSIEDCRLFWSILENSGYPRSALIFVCS